MPAGGDQGEDALQDPDGDAVDGAAAVALEVELALEGVVDGLDDLPRAGGQATIGEDVGQDEPLVGLAPART